MALEGQFDAIKRLNREIAKIEGRTLAGLLKAAHLIEAESKKRTPYKTGNLKSSHYVDPGQTSAGPVAEIGLVAEYALYVHENARGVKFAHGEDKFLEKALVENRDTVLKIIADNVTIK